MEAVFQAILTLLVASYDAAFYGLPFLQCTPHQACMVNPLPEVQLSVNPFLDLPVLVGAQYLCQKQHGQRQGVAQISASNLVPPANPQTVLQ